MVMPLYIMVLRRYHPRTLLQGHWHTISSRGRMVADGALDDFEAANGNDIVLRYPAVTTPGIQS